MIEAAVAAVSLRRIKRLVWRAFRVQTSHEYVRNIVNAASARARQALERLAPEKQAHRAVGDEIFLGARPLLVVAEPRSLAILRVGVEEHRDQETWSKILSPLPQNLEAFASDLGKGLTAAVEKRGWPHQADLFHALRILMDSHSREERRCYEAIEEEYAYARRLEKLRDAGEDTRGVATNHALAAKKTQRALERFGEIERLVRQMRSAVVLVDDVGRWIAPQERESLITAAMNRLDELGLARRRRVAGYWRNPKLLTFARGLQAHLDALEISPGLLSRRDLIDAAAGAWALGRGRLRGPGALATALRAHAARQACPEFPDLCSRVARVLDNAFRASSAIETLNSLLRVYQQTKKSFGTDFAYLVALYHNTHRFDEGPRKGRTPFEILGIDVATDDWLSLVL
jgi:hypothetical protein